MRYRELEPSPALGPYVRCYWTLEAPGSSEAAAQRVLPDGCVEIIINLGDEFARHDVSGLVERQPRMLLVGPTTTHMSIAPTGAIRLVGVRFRPGGARPFLAVPAHEVRDAAPALDDLVPVLGPVLADRLATVARGAEACVLDRALGVRLGGARRSAGDRVLAAVRAIYDAAHASDVDALVASTGLGVRQLERTFRDTIGFGPKTLCRLARFQGVVRALESRAGTTWARLAADHGYADQPHLAREFREFAGTTLSGYLRELHPMSDRFHNGPAAEDAETAISGVGDVVFLQDRTDAGR
jgi:methylphosphotriester-DNA--protein-cysteine methyltransferase